MKSLKRKTMKFSLIEIAVSIFIVAIVLTVVVSSLPVSLEANRSAIAKSNAADSADQFLNYMAARLETNWNELNAFPDYDTLFNSDGTAKTNDLELSYSDQTLIPDANIKIQFQANNVEDQWNASSNTSGIFKVTQFTSANAIDFSGVIRAWKSTSTGQNSAETATLYIQVSYPSNIPFENRTKSTYQMEVYRPGTLVYSSDSSDDIDVGSSYMANMPCKTLWAVDDTNSKLYYFQFQDGFDFSNTEGQIIGTDHYPNTNIESLVIASDGTMYCVDNYDNKSVLYKINTEDIDQDSNTDVTVTRIGDTGLSGSSRLTNLQFVDNKLYGIGHTTGDIYELNTETGAITKVGDIGISSFTCDAMTVGADGTVYLLKPGSTSTVGELWKFNSFPSGGIVKVMDISGSQSVESLSAHASGMLYCVDGTTWFEIDPSTLSVTEVVSYSNSIEGVDFWYNAESVHCDNSQTVVTDDQNGDLSGLININPSNNGKLNEFEMELTDGTIITRDDLTDGWSCTDLTVAKVHFRPKGNANKNSMTIDGDGYELLNGEIYDVTGNVVVTIAKQGNGNGQLWMTLTGTGCQIEIYKGSQNQ